MPYSYLEDIAISDVAFEATGATLPEVFLSSARALTGAMVEDPAGLEGHVPLEISLQAPSLEMLLYDFLSELVFIKDARRLLLDVRDVEIGRTSRGFSLRARALGSPVEGLGGRLRADVKAVTMHRFSLRDEGGTWRARVVLDV